jgi:hypothetical protein
VKNQNCTVATATISGKYESLVVLLNSERHCGKLVGGIHLNAVVAIVWN